MVMRGKIVKTMSMTVTIFHAYMGVPVMTGLQAFTVNVQKEGRVFFVT